MVEKRTSFLHNKQFRTWIRWLGTIASSGLFVWLIARQKWDLVLVTASRIALWSIPVVVACYVLAQVANAGRWFSLLKAQKVAINFWQTFSIVLVGAFASNFLPTTIGGDTVRAVAIFRYTDRKTVGLGSIILDRLLNITTMLMTLPVAWFVFGNPVELMSWPTPQVKFVSLGIVSASWKGWIEKAFSKALRAYRVWADRPWALAQALLIAVISNVLVMLGSWIMTVQLGMGVTFIQVVGVMSISYVLTNLPISINGYGVREVALTALYMRLGATVEQASTLALIMRLIAVLVTMPGVLWLSRSLSVPLEKASGQTIEWDEEARITES